MSPDARRSQRDFDVHAARIADIDDLRQSRKGVIQVAVDDNPVVGFEVRARFDRQIVPKLLTIAAQAESVNLDLVAEHRPQIAQMSLADAS